MFSRRHFIATGAGALAAAALHARPLRAADYYEEAMPTTPADALSRLQAGNARFASGQPLAPQRDLAHLRAIAPKQTPFGAVLACADSRVRNATNPPSISSTDPATANSNRNERLTWRPVGPAPPSPCSGRTGARAA